MTTTVVDWQVKANYVWHTFPTSITSMLEKAFSSKKATISLVSTIRCIDWNPPFVLPECLFHLDNMIWEHYYLRRVGGGDTLSSDFNVKYWNDETHWTHFDRDATLQIGGALLYGRNATCIYTEEAAYDIDLREKTQTNRDTDKTRGIMISNFAQPRNFKRASALAWSDDICEDSIPDEYYCPISNSLMKEPVNADDGNTYEYSYISTWLEKKLTSPITNEPMGPGLTHNRSLRSLMQKCIEESKSTEGARHKRSRIP
jgi:hypothetical protein